MKTLLEYLSEQTLPQIYLDMDGVLVDLEKRVSQIMKQRDGQTFDDWLKMPSDDQWAIVKQDKNFWENLEMSDDAKKLFKFVKQYNPNILSAYTKRDLRSKKGKMRWLQKNIGLNNLNRIHLVLRPEKKNFAQSKQGPNILIDDYIGNIKEFNAAGGIGIFYKNSTDTIRQLKKLGF